MQIYAYLSKSLFLKKGHTLKMGAISLEILHLLKVKLSLQNDQRWLLLLSWFSKFSGGEPPTGNVIYFSIQHCMLNTSLRLKVRFSTLALKQQE